MAISILVKNPEAGHEGCRILYRDVGNYLSREEKLGILREAGSIAGIDDWRMIVPDTHCDWIGQRDEAFRALCPVGSKEAKAGQADDAIFRLYSNGYKTGRDFYVWAPLRIRDLTEDDWLNGLWPSAAMLAPEFPGVSRAPIELSPLQDRAQAISYSEYCHTAAARRSSWTRRRML